MLKALVIGLLSCTALPARAMTWHVVAEHDRLGDGLSWETATGDLGDIANWIEPGDTVLFGPGDIGIDDRIDCTDIELIGAGSEETRFVPAGLSSLPILLTVEAGHCAVSGVEIGEPWGLLEGKIVTLPGTALELDDVVIGTHVEAGGELDMTGAAFVDGAHLRVSAAAYARHGSFAETEIEVVGDAVFVGRKLVFDRALISLVSQASARISDSDGHRWGVRQIGGGTLDLRRNTFAGPNAAWLWPAVTTAARSLRFEANLVEGVEEGLVLDLNPFVTGASSLVIDNVFDGVTAPIRVLGHGAHVVVHNTFIAPDEATGTIGHTMLLCDVTPSSEGTRPSVAMSNNAIEGYEFVVWTEELCPVTLGGNAWFVKRGTAELVAASPLAWDMPDTRFNLNERYRPMSDASVLVAAVPKPAGVVGLARDFYGKERRWPASIGAVERSIKTVSLSPEDARPPTKGW